MIQQNCKYSYYTKPCGVLSDCNIILPAEFLQIIQQRRALNITGFTDGIVVTVKAHSRSPLYKFPVLRSSYFCYWTPDSIETLYRINESVADIINSRLGQKCIDAERARIAFIAEVLGSRGDTDA